MLLICPGVVLGLAREVHVTWFAMWCEFCVGGLVGCGVG